MDTELITQEDLNDFLESEINGAVDEHLKFIDAVQYLNLNLHNEASYEVQKLLHICSFHIASIVELAKQQGTNIALYPDAIINLHEHYMKIFPDVIRLKAEAYLLTAKGDIGAAEVLERLINLKRYLKTKDLN